MGDRTKFGSRLSAFRVSLSLAELDFHPPLSFGSTPLQVKYKVYEGRKAADRDCHEYSTFSGGL